MKITLQLIVDKKLKQQVLKKAKGWGISPDDIVTECFMELIYRHRQNKKQ